jgi:hypothetical protein
MTQRERLAVRLRFARLPKPHGSEAGYRAGCRCGPCTAAHSDRIAKARWLAHRGRESDDWGGRAACYNRRCTHEKCRAAHAERARLYQERRRRRAPWEGIRG